MGPGYPEFNVSEKYKCVWAAPERTGSRKVAEILRYFNFTCDGREIFNGEFYFYSHNCLTGGKYDGYQIICNARNPYTRVHSIFKNYYTNMVNDKSKDFEYFVKNELDSVRFYDMIIRPKLDSVPDYIIRVEHMLEDLKKLPFIYDVLNERQLGYLVEHGKIMESCENFYDQEMKDIVYGMLKYQFDTFGYEK